MEEPFAKRRKGEKENSMSAQEAISFHLLRRVDGQVVMEEDGTFPPQMTHQLFGEDEVIKGYDALEIDIWLTPQLQALVDVKFAQKEAGATDLAAPFRELWGDVPFYTQKADFDKALQDEAPLALSDLGEQVATADTDEGTQFLLLRSQLATASAQLKALHARLQPLLVFFVDGASAIDAEDEGWELYVAVERAPDGALDVVGFATTFAFYRYPEGSRLRLSQVLVLPPHQGRRLGSLLLEAVAVRAEELGAADLTFEDPTEQLQRMRDKLDLQRALALGWPRRASEETVAAALADKGKGKAAAEDGAPAAAGSSGSSAAPAFPLAPPRELLTRLRRELRLSKLQAARVYEALVVLAAGAAGKGAEALAEAMVRGRVQSEVEAAQREGGNKVLTETESGFVMRKGQGGLVPAGAVEGVSAEEKAEAMEAAVEQRLGALRAAVAAVAVALEG